MTGISAKGSFMGTWQMVLYYDNAVMVKAFFIVFVMFFQDGLSDYAQKQTGCVLLL